VTLETDRLVLRDWGPDDAPVVLDILGRADVVRWLDDAEPVLLTELDDALAKIRSWQDLVPPLHQWAIEVRDTGDVVGWVCLVPIPNSGGLVQIGWTLHPDAHGHGYASEAARTVLAHGLASGLAEIRALMIPDNEPSIRVARRLGMRDAGLTDLWYDGPSRVFLAP
jgi:RimJ/RimL family protein N-acetyltransferase